MSKKHGPKSGYWKDTPGFLEWFKANAALLTNRELIAQATQKFKVPLSRPAVESLRRTYQVAMTPDTKRRAYDARTTKATPAPQKEDGLSPQERMDRALLVQRVKRLTARQTFYQLCGQAIIDAVRELPKLPPVRVPTIRVPKTLSEEEAVLVISDVQAGLTTSAKESGGLGEFDTEILTEEIQYLEDSLVSIQRYYPNVKKLNVVFNGDIVEGEDIFGGQLREIDMTLVEQIVFIKERFARLLYNLAHHFEKVWCTGVVGNHGRIGRKGEHSPMSNFDYLCYRWLEERLKPVKNLTWDIPETWWKIMHVQGWRFLCVHGDDTGGSFGGIPFYGMTRHKSRYREMLKISGRMKDGPPEDFDYMILGHHSEAAQFQGVISAGSWPGGTEFSLKRMQMAAIPSAPFFGVHKSHGVTWRRDLQLRPLKP